MPNLPQECPLTRITNASRLEPRRGLESATPGASTRTTPARPIGHALTDWIAKS